MPHLYESTGSRKVHCVATDGAGSKMLAEHGIRTEPVRSPTLASGDGLQSTTLHVKRAVHKAQSVMRLEHAGRRVSLCLSRTFEGRDQGAAQDPSHTNSHARKSPPIASHWRVHPPTRCAREAVRSGPVRFGQRRLDHRWPGSSPLSAEETSAKFERYLVHTLAWERKSPCLSLSAVVARGLPFKYVEM